MSIVAGPHFFLVAAQRFVHFLIHPAIIEAFATAALGRRLSDNDQFAAKGVVHFLDFLFQT
jgi:hypothetical protein